MGMFIEVESVEKNCTVIINLDAVIEIAPLVRGGCEIKMQDDGVSKNILHVKDDYEQFKQFAMKTVSSDDIAKRIDSINKSANVDPKKLQKENRKEEMRALIEERREEAARKAEESKQSKMGTTSSAIEG